MGQVRHGSATTTPDGIDAHLFSAALSFLDGR